MRPCPTCQCFVPVAAHHCPRCDAALEPIDLHEDGGTESRDLVLIGALTGTANGTANGTAGNGGTANGGTPLTGAAHDVRAVDAATRSILARVTLPPIDGPAGRLRQPSLPKLPQPYAPDPLVLAVFLGIPLVDPGPHDTHDTHARVDVAPTPDVEADVEPEIEEPHELAPDTFSALLGIPREDLLPNAPTIAPTPTASPTRPPAPALVAVPVATSSVHIEPLVVPGRRRLFTRNDPFARSRTRRERVLTRICLLLVIAVAVTVIVLRLPLGIRPELSTIVVRDGVSTSVTRFDDPLLLQARIDLNDTLAVAEEVYPSRNTYASATPDVLGDSLPQLKFVAGTRVSRRTGEISVAGSAEKIVLAEVSSPGRCAFARLVGSERAETAELPNDNPCRASAAPKTGWTPLETG